MTAASVIGFETFRAKMHLHEPSCCMIDLAEDPKWTLQNSLLHELLFFFLSRC